METAPTRSIQQEVLHMRGLEVEHAVHELKAKLSHEGRCPVCTLKVPCKHFSGKDSLPMIEVATMNAQALSKAAVSKPVRRVLQSPDKKLATLDRLEVLRENKLQKELEKIEQLKKQEQLDAERQKRRDAQRAKRLQKQRAKLEQYRTEVKEKYFALQEESKREAARLASFEERRRKYLEEQRQKLSDYYTQKETQPLKQQSPPKDSKRTTRIPKTDYRRVYLNA